MWDTSQDYRLKVANRSH